MANKGKPRFKTIYNYNSFGGAWQRILADAETGVQYLLAGDNLGAGITPLIGPDGKQLLCGPEDLEQ